ncbi:hypothetical protein HYC85_000229 [Camellia sinensis]|uniref:PGG domain-containing protein n=1 Tax=Camellia sinensis TaxID=4442 RepID=A0A7J7I1V0_CAMSI|nr:hypothetical protein HYC85_000229 [Camellia sinensis]
MEINESANNSKLSLRNEEILVAVSKKIIHRLVVRIVPPTIKLDKNLWWPVLIKLIFLKKTLHEAGEYGDLKSVEELIRENKDSCLEKNEFGFTPLHIAAQSGRIDVVDLILKYCPEAVKEVTAKTMRTCFHVAVNHNQIEVVMHLLRWVVGERPDFLYLLSLKDYKGKTAVQFSTSSKQFQVFISLSILVFLEFVSSIFFFE